MTGVKAAREWVDFGGCSVYLVSPWAVELETAGVTDMAALLTIAGAVSRGQLLPYVLVFVL